MGGLMSFFSGGKPKTPVPGLGFRLANLFKNNFRGIFGVIIALCLSYCKHMEHHLTVKTIWCIMLIFFLLQPVPIPVTAFIPIFILPLCGVMSSAETCECYFNDNVVFMFLGGLMHLLLNNSGFDRRLVNCLVYDSSPGGYSASKLLIKCSLAAFFASMVSNRLLVSAYVIDMMATQLIDLQKATSKAPDTDYGVYRDLLCMAIQVSSVCGSLVFFHGNYGLLIFRTVFECFNTPKISTSELAEKTERFNYAQFMAVSVPISIILFIVNLIYFMVLLKIFCKHDISSWSREQIRNAVQNKRKLLKPSMTLHEKLTVFFYLLFVAVLVTRHIEILNFGWSILYQRKKGGIKDACVAAIFVIILSILPNGCSFTKLIFATKKSQVSMKPESAIMFWRFVNMYTNYGYVFLFGSSIALMTAINLTRLNVIIADGLEDFAKTDFKVLMILACLAVSVLSNIMPGVPAFIVLYPAVDSVIRNSDVRNPEAHKRLHLYAMAMGFACNFTFCVPFANSPARYCTVNGKMKIFNMIKYGACAVIISSLIVFAVSAFLAQTVLPVI